MPRWLWNLSWIVWFLERFAVLDWRGGRGRLPACARRALVQMRTSRDEICRCEWGAHLINASRFRSMSALVQACRGCDGQTSPWRSFYVAPPMAVCCLRFFACCATCNRCSMGSEQISAAYLTEPIITNIRVRAISQRGDTITTGSVRKKV
jgi:hypothetical protein